MAGVRVVSFPLRAVPGSGTVERLEPRLAAFAALRLRSVDIEQMKFPVSFDD